MHVGVACQRHDMTMSVSSYVFVSSGYGTRLLAERAEVVEGWAAVATAMPHLRQRVRFRGEWDGRLRRYII
jgi:hypothetical protein